MANLQHTTLIAEQARSKRELAAIVHPNGTIIRYVKLPHGQMEARWSTGHKYIMSQDGLTRGR